MRTEYRNRPAPVPEGWEKIHDLRWFAENLNSAHFRALSSGLSLGALRPAGTRAQRAVMPVTAPAHFSAQPVLPTVQPVTPAAQKLKRGQRKSKDENFASAGRKEQTVHVPATYARLLSAWVFDFFVVVLSLAVAFAVAVILTMLKTGETDNWLALRPIKFLAARRPIEILASVYAIFALYMLVFKFGAGKTVGEVIFLRKRAKTAHTVTS